MAKKSSRKGKKAWRTNIPSKDVDDYVDRAAHDERHGGSLDALPDERLFFVDKSADVSLAKKTSKHKEKMLRCEAILERSSLVPPLPAAKKKCKKAKPITKRLHHIGGSKGKQGTKELRDIWSAEDTGSKELVASNQVQPKKLRTTSLSAKAVEVDAPGCSYNPPFEDHQEALGLAVAQEMQKVYQKELEPPPIPRTVLGEVIDEEDVYFLEVHEEGDETEIEDNHSRESRPIKVKKLTRADLNKKKRRKEQLKIEEQSQKRAKLGKDVLNLDEIIRDIEDEEHNKHQKWVRRTVAKQEKCAQGPPRLGKHRFQPDPVQVLLSEEVTGSLRKLKGCYMLAKERYKSLQRRGLIEPRGPGKRRSRKKRVEYEEGSKGQMEREMHGVLQGHL